MKENYTHCCFQRWLPLQVPQSLASEQYKSICTIRGTAHPIRTVTYEDLLGWNSLPPLSALGASEVEVKHWPCELHLQSLLMSPN